MTTDAGSPQTVGSEPVKRRARRGGRQAKAGDGDRQVEKLAGLLGKFMESSDERMKALEASVQQVLTKASEPQRMPTVIPDEERLRAVRSVNKSGDMGDSRKMRDLRYPQATTTGYQPGDVVALREDTERAQKTKANIQRVNLTLPEDGRILGVVKSFMYVNRAGLRKYKVTFEGLGDDGVPENELELVQAA